MNSEGQVDEQRSRTITGRGCPAACSDDDADASPAASSSQTTQVSWHRGEQQRARRVTHNRSIPREAGRVPLRKRARCSKLNHPQGGRSTHSR